ncbi:hypothetical protein CHS0354_010900 [Potamilus streckersoni]|uniref:Uncharacterized protein n=1 Tax=Potamilus streckersoni TaxID=2493646 RepID=A0AAE0W010_9BIVA|nr:hypothetical protein CHS0354_010900 [Potamilus streckersoni]
MAQHVGYDLVRTTEPMPRQTRFKRDRMAPITTLNRIATVACERIVLMLNNTEIVKELRLKSMNDVLKYLNGQHDDLGLSGDRGDFYRRKLAEQMYLNFSIQGVDHTNVMSVVEAAILLERETRKTFGSSTQNRDWAPSVEIDETILDILTRIAGIF